MSWFNYKDNKGIVNYYQSESFINDTQDNINLNLRTKKVSLFVAQFTDFIVVNKDNEWHINIKALKIIQKYSHYGYKIILYDYKTNYNWINFITPFLENIFVKFQYFLTSMFCFYSYPCNGFIELALKINNWEKYNSNQYNSYFVSLGNECDIFFNNKFNFILLKWNKNNFEKIKNLHNKIFQKQDIINHINSIKFESFNRIILFMGLPNEIIKNHLIKKYIKPITDNNYKIINSKINNTILAINRIKYYLNINTSIFVIGHFNTIHNRKKWINIADKCCCPIDIINININEVEINQINKVISEKCINEINYNNTIKKYYKKLKIPSHKEGFNIIINTNFTQFKENIHQYFTQLNYNKTTPN